MTTKEKTLRIQLEWLKNFLQLWETDSEEIYPQLEVLYKSWVENNKLPLMSCDDLILELDHQLVLVMNKDTIEYQIQWLWDFHELFENTKNQFKGVLVDVFTKFIQTENLPNYGSPKELIDYLNEKLQKIVS